MLETLKQALDVCEHTDDYDSETLDQIATNLRTLIEQMEKVEPFAWYLENEDEFITEKLRKEHERVNSYTFKLCKVAIPLYTAPAVPEAQVMCPVCSTWVSTLGRPKG